LTAAFYWYRTLSSAVLTLSCRRPPSTSFFTHPSTPHIYTLSLHDALPISTASSTTYWIIGLSTSGSISFGWAFVAGRNRVPKEIDRKSTRLNSSHEWISYAVFCLKKKKDRTGTTSRIRREHV